MRLQFRFRFLTTMLLFIAATAIAQQPAAPAAPSTPELAKALAELKAPPTWYDSVAVTYDCTNTWKDARLEVRRLLGLGGENQRVAMKISWTYLQKGDPGAKGETPTYLLLGGEYAWAIQELLERLPEIDAAGTGEGSHARTELAVCYRHYGANAEARAVLDEAFQHLPAPPWTEARTSYLHDRLGDLLADTGKADEARREYEQAIADLEAAKLAAKQPYGLQNIPRQVAQIRTKIALAGAAPIQPGQLRDGVYTGEGNGYVDQVSSQVTVTGGRIASVAVQHKENIEQGATKIVPARIVEKQSPRVDGVTGATVTAQAIMTGAYQALQQAGMGGAPAAAPAGTVGAPARTAGAGAAGAIAGPTAAPASAAKP
jgi:uncharacterized protein with FMN-binding domain